MIWLYEQDKVLRFFNMFRMQLSKVISRHLSLSITHIGSEYRLKAIVPKVRLNSVHSGGCGDNLQIIGTSISLLLTTL